MRDENFVRVCTTEEARNYFYSNGLGYSDVDYASFLLLCIYIRQELDASNKSGETSVCTMSLENKFKFVEDKSRGMLSGGTTMKSHYFKNRECITFNEGGFIGFAGWADEYNLNPILRAFLRWCDTLVQKKKSGVVEIKFDEEE